MTKDNKLPLSVVKRGAIMLLLAVFVLLAAIVFFADNIVKVVLERELAARIVPDLHIAGPVQLQLHPEPVLTVHHVVLNDRNGDALLVVPEIRLTFDRDALFHGRVVLDAALVTGLDLRLRRDDDALWKRDGWLHATDQPAQGGMPPVGQVRIRDATIRIQDDAPLWVSRLQLEAGPLALDTPATFTLEMALERAAPDAVSRGQVTLAGGFVLAEHGLVAYDLIMAVDGSTGAYDSVRGEAVMRRVDRSADEKIRIEGMVFDLAVVGASGEVGAHASIEVLHGLGKTWKAESASIDAQLRVDDWIFSGQLSTPDSVLHAGSLNLPSFSLTLVTDGPMAMSLDALAALALDINDAGGEVRVSEARGRLALPHPAGHEVPLEIDFRGDAMWSRLSEIVEGQVSGSFDQSTFDGGWRYAPAEVPPVSLDLALDRLDIDDYMPPPARDTAPADLTMWRNWPVEAELSVGELRLQGFVSRDARLSLRGR